jgi:hypothetical protein
MIIDRNGMGRVHILQEKVPVPVDMMTWALWLEDHQTDRIGKQEDVAHFWVSTVFLGLDHSFGDGAPLVFETMVFDTARVLTMQPTPGWSAPQPGS